MKIGTDGVLLGAWVPATGGPSEIWDVGTGTGLIALMAAQRFEGAHITAVEIDEESACEATGNFAASPWSERLTLVKGDILEVAPGLPAPDMIISNPPFFNEKVFSPDNSRRQARHEASLSIESLISLASIHLSRGGHLAFIAPYSRLEEIEYTAFLKKMIPTHLVPVISRDGNRAVRLLVNLIKGGTPRPADRSEIIIRDADNQYTDSYRALTNDFYTHLK